MDRAAARRLCELARRIVATGLFAAARSLEAATRASGAVKYLCQSVLVLMLAVEGAANSLEGFSERKDLRANQEIVILGSDRMPEHALGRDRHFRNEVHPRQGDAFSRSAAQRNPPDHPILFADALRLKEAGKLLGLFIRRHGRRQSHTKASSACELDSLPGAIPRSLAAMLVMATRRRTVEADLKGDTLARQRA